MTMPLRVTLSRNAWGDLLAHAKESLEAEVCGVLVGKVKEHEEDTQVDVRAVIRGAAAREARAHVTFTHETWNRIHATLDKEYPKLQIVGWYHTHPGFGVEFSAMDRFIQENFFSGKTQVAFLSDPLGSDVALAYNGESGIEYLPRFFVDGREMPAKLPSGSGPAETTTAVASGGGGDARREIERLESRINQLVQSLDETQRNFYRMLMALVVIICLGVIGGVGNLIWSDRANHIEPPKGMAVVPVPVKIGNDTAYLGVAVVDWKLPPQLDAMYDKLAKLEFEEAKRQRDELMRQQQEQQKKAPPARKP